MFGRLREGSPESVRGNFEKISYTFYVNQNVPSNFYTINFRRMGQYYHKVMMKVMEKGDEFIATESTRIGKLLGWLKLYTFGTFSQFSLHYFILKSIC